MEKRSTGVKYLILSVGSERVLALGALGSTGLFLNQKMVQGGSSTEQLLSQIIKFVQTNWAEKLPVGIIVTLEQKLSFTQARLICAVGNALAYAWGRKICLVSKINWVTESVAVKKLKWQKAVKAEYYGPGVGSSK